MKTRSFHSHEKGQSLAELAISLVLVLIILAGVVDLGRMMYEYLSMRDSAQEGASYGAIYPRDCSETEARVRSNLPSDFFSDSGDTLNVYIDTIGQQCSTAPVTQACEGHTIYVVLDHTSEMTMPFFSGVIVPMHVEIQDLIIVPGCEG